MQSILINSIFLSMALPLLLGCGTVKASIVTKWDALPINDVRYEADYEIQVKNTSEKIFIAYIIEEGDLIIKKKCRCISWNKCDIQNAVKLSK